MYLITSPHPRLLSFWPAPPEGETRNSRFSEFTRAEQVTFVVTQFRTSLFGAHAAVDTTFVQFYPTLLPVARAKGTLSSAYQKEAKAPAK